MIGNAIAVSNARTHVWTALEDARRAKRRLGDVLIYHNADRAAVEEVDVVIGTLDRVLDELDVAYNLLEHAP